MFKSLLKSSPKYHSESSEGLFFIARFLCNESDLRESREKHVPRAQIALGMTNSLGFNKLLGVQIRTSIQRTGAFEIAGNFQKQRFVGPFRDELQSNGQPGFRQATRHGNSGYAG